MSTIYDIDIQTATRWNIRRKYRKSKILALLYAGASPFGSIYQLLLKYRKSKLYQIMITGQKCYLERLLNDRYDFTLRGIYIDDPDDKSAKYIYQSAELKPLFIHSTTENEPFYLFTSGESGAFKNDFIVFVPDDISFDINEMSSLVKAYKLAGTKFKIQTYFR